MTEKLDFTGRHPEDLNTTPENLAAAGPDAELIERISYFAKEIREKRATFQSAIKRLLDEFPNKLQSYVKPPLVVLMVRTLRDFWWTPSSGEEQFLKAGGHLMLSYNKSKKVWDIWGVDHAAIGSYSPIKDSDDVKEYLALVGRPLDETIIPNMGVKFRFGTEVHHFEDTKPEELVFRMAVKSAATFVYFAESDYEIWGLESTEPYKVTKGTPVLIGILMEMWIRKLDEFTAVYVRTDIYSVNLNELVEFLLKVGNMTPEELAAQSEKIQYKLWEYGLRLSIFRSTTDRAIVETSQFLSYQSMTTTRLMQAVVIPPGEGTEK